MCGGPLPEWVLCAEYPDLATNPDADHRATHEHHRADQYHGTKCDADQDPDAHENVRTKCDADQDSYPDQNHDPESNAVPHPGSGHLHENADRDPHHSADADRRLWS